MAEKRSSGRGPRSARNQPPLDAEQIVAAAVRLTRLHGLESWTVRQLADELESWPAVMYHHVGDREAVTTAVVDHVLSGVMDADLPSEWRDWFAEVLRRLGAALRAHPGIARWLAVNGPVVPAMLRLIDRGVVLLAAAGFGNEAPAAYSMLVDVAVMRIAVEEGRDSHALPCEEVERVLAEYRDRGDRRGLRLVVSACRSGWEADGLYDYSVERTLDGIALRLAELRGGAPA